MLHTEVVIFSHSGRKPSSTLLARPTTCCAVLFRAGLSRGDTVSGRVPELRSAGPIKAGGTTMAPGKRAGLQGAIMLLIKEYLEGVLGDEITAP